MTLQEIDALTLDDVFFEILNKLVDYSPLPDGEMAHTLSDDETLSMYDRVTLHDSLTKPSLADMEAEFTSYQTSLREQEEERLRRVAWVEDKKQRWDAIGGGDVRKVFNEVTGEANPALYLKKHILDLVGSDEATAEANLKALEDAWYQKKLELQQLEEERPIREIRKKRNKVLSETDYTQLADAPLDSTQKTEMRNYRQYLRDIPTLWKNKQISELKVMTLDEWRESNLSS